MAHTPGPWEWAELGGQIRLCTPDRGRIIVLDCARNGARAEMRLGIRSEADEGGIMQPLSAIELSAHADARLIAAAPELLAALGWIADRLKDGTDEQVTIEPGSVLANRILAAVAKADGQ